jgi:UDP-N-acetylglucosamine diphosphorylase/glucosamine-1-phosphate N-acetyltransferase
MQKYILLDHPKVHSDLKPLTITRAICDLRIGITTILEKWELMLGHTCDVHTMDYLQPLYPFTFSSDSIFIFAHFIPNEVVIKSIKSLPTNSALYFEDIVIAFRSDKNKFSEDLQKLYISAKPIAINFPWDIFTHNASVLEQDFSLITLGRVSKKIDIHSKIIGDPSRLFIEPDAIVNASIFNTTMGSIYIGKEAEVMENTVIRGGFALCEHAQTKLSTKVYGATTIGPYSKIGGEVSNSILIGYSNKGHDGFLGNSVLGEWCNLGADTNNSNLKNNYSNVSCYNYTEQKEISTNLQFCGLIMGDHSKSGINTMFNTGTVCGVSSNIFGAGFPSKHIPSFSWGEKDTYEFDKAIDVAQKVMARRNIKLSHEQIEVLKYIFAAYVK